MLVLMEGLALFPLGFGDNKLNFSPLTVFFFFPKQFCASKVTMATCSPSVSFPFLRCSPAMVSCYSAVPGDKRHRCLRLLFPPFPSDVSSLTCSTPSRFCSRFFLRRFFQAVEVISRQRATPSPSNARLAKQKRDFIVHIHALFHRPPVFAAMTSSSARVRSSFSTPSFSSFKPLAAVRPLRPSSSS